MHRAALPPLSRWTLALTALVSTACAQADLAAQSDDAGLLQGGVPPEGNAPQRKPAPGSSRPAVPDAQDASPGRKPPREASPEGCGQVDTAGLCRGPVAWWCEGGVLVSQDCEGLDATCIFRVDLNAFRCDPSVPEVPEPVGPDAPDDPGDPANPNDPEPPPDDESPPPEDPNFPGDEPFPPDDEPAAPGDGGACGGVDYLGECRGSVAVWCGDGVLQSVDCAQYAVPCVWIDEATGYYCEAPAAEPVPDPGPDPDPDPGNPPEPGPDPDPAPGGCGLPPEGECQGDIARFCIGDEVLETDCSLYGEQCGFINDLIGWYCISEGGPPDPGPAPEPDPLPEPDACEGIDYLGICDGDVAVWCANGLLEFEDCAAFGETCGYVDDATGYYCQPAP